MILFFAFAFGMHFTFIVLIVSFIFVFLFKLIKKNKTVPFVPFMTVAFFGILVITYIFM